ncbi:spore germination protein [Paenibacillus sp. yr247]|uniref:spore germination protein n=1 Tax=Paenibacillus sp. yr247 TaxID=1761880 RepID=UPI0008920FAD|nr:spore germination protein [Paenibacillus sp. yr247]SDO71884.1 spore germination protein [Paenibacillus sp. yr247]
MGFFRNLIRVKRRYPPQQKANLQISKPLSMDLDENLLDLQTLFTLAPDLITRQFQIKSTQKRAALVYLNDLTDRKAINSDVLQPLMQEIVGDMPIDQIVTVGSIQSVHDLSQVEQAILHGQSVLFVEDKNTADLLDTQGWPQRAIQDPQLEASLKGSHQGFVETGSINIALIRRYIPNRELKIKECIVGERGMTRVSILYLADVAQPEVLQELEKRIQKIDVDAILNTGELEEFIEDNPYSPFPHFSITERPDSVASQILQGRLAVVVDRSPFVLIGPANFAMFFQSTDDYNMRWQVASFLRILRFSAFFVTIFLPAIYIAVISFNFEVIPMQLLLSVGESRASIPFPPIIEAFIMEITLEMLKEAGIRLPAPIGQTVGIVGAIVIGQATVQAGIVSNIMVIVVSLTALSSFIIPSHDMSAAIRLIRFPMMLIAAFFGLFGVGIGMMVMFGHLIALESLGTPYFSPFSPMRFKDLKDSFVRLPLFFMRKRPLSARPTQEKRQGSNHSKGDG